LEKGYPPTPIVGPWFKLFYHLVAACRNELPVNDYKSMLIAFDDERGVHIHSRKVLKDKNYNGS